MIITNEIMLALPPKINEFSFCERIAIAAECIGMLTMMEVPINTVIMNLNSMKINIHTSTIRNIAVQASEFFAKKSKKSPRKRVIRFRDLTLKEWC